MDRRRGIDVVNADREKKVVKHIFQEVTFGIHYPCLDTCCSHFLTIIAGVDLHFTHESKLIVC